MANVIHTGPYTIEFVLLLVAALGACAAAVFTAFSTRATAKASRGETLLSCLEKYISIMKDKRTARENRDFDLAKEFYRELFDLHWSEFHLWHEGAIPDGVMLSWMTVRKRNYEVDSIACQSKEGKEEIITYENMWKELKNTSYFEGTDPFVKFMDEAHSCTITNIKKLKKKTRKWQ